MMVGVCVGGGEGGWRLSSKESFILYNDHIMISLYGHV